MCSADCAAIVLRYQLPLVFVAKHTEFFYHNSFSFECCLSSQGVLSFLPRGHSALVSSLYLDKQPKLSQIEVDLVINQDYSRDSRACRPFAAGASGP